MVITFKGFMHNHMLRVGAQIEPVVLYHALPTLPVHGVGVARFKNYGTA